VNRRTRAALLTGAALTAACLLPACGSDGDGNAQSSPSDTQLGDAATTTAVVDGSTDPGADPAVETVVAASVHEPTVLIPRPGDDGHLWLAERAGRVRRLAIADGGNTLSTTGDYLLDISDDTTVDAERGLLGMTFSPDGTTLYVSYTNADGNTRVVSYATDGEAIDASSRAIVYATDQPYPNHNGGNIAFGPDGMLWLGLGDGGAADDPENRAQDPDADLGKMLRIDPETLEREIVVSGVRNPWRWAFDTDGSLWIADVGQRQWEEINHLPADEIAGANLGWSGYEGTRPYLDGDGRRSADAIPPVFEYGHEDGNCSITGGFPYRGTAIPALEGAFLFADYCAGGLRAVRLADDGTLDRELDLGIDFENPISFGQDQAGEPYVLLAGGNIVRLLPAG
jgi:glucose/arabinose dehydrogenase